MRCGAEGNRKRNQIEHPVSCTCMRSEANCSLNVSVVDFNFYCNQIEWEKDTASTEIELK